jgi:hypothetical protein
LQSSFSWLAKGAGEDGDRRNAIEAVTASIAAAYLFVPPLVDELTSDNSAFGAEDGVSTDAYVPPDAAEFTSAEFHLPPHATARNPTLPPPPPEPAEKVGASELKSIFHVNNFDGE